MNKEIKGSFLPMVMLPCGRLCYRGFLLLSQHLDGLGELVSPISQRVFETNWKKWCQHICLHWKNPSGGL